MEETRNKFYEHGAEQGASLNLLDYIFGTFKDSTQAWLFILCITYDGLFNYRTTRNELRLTTIQLYTGILHVYQLMLMQLMRKTMRY